MWIILNYDEAHEKTNLKYNYQVLVKKLMDKKARVNSIDFFINITVQ